MNELELFSYGGRQVRVVVAADGEPWFIAQDACAVLGYSRIGDAMRMLSDSDRRTHVLRGNDQGEHLTQIISLGGLFTLAISSRRPEAHPFRHWVAHDVLPAIYRTGTYSLPAQRQPEPAQLDRRALAQMVLDSEDARAAAEHRAIEARAQVAELAPRAALADQVIDATGTWSVREVAQILVNDPAIRAAGLGQIRLFRRLREEFQWLDGQGHPRQRYLEQGLLQSRPRSYKHPNSGERVKAEAQVRITGKGLAKLHQMLGGTADLAALIDSEALL